MNKQQQQNAMLKLATVRLAINHVLRSRAMQKQAEGNKWVNGRNPNYDEYGRKKNLKREVIDSRNFPNLISGSVVPNYPNTNLPQVNSFIWSNDKQPKVSPEYEYLLRLGDTIGTGYSEGADTDNKYNVNTHTAGNPRGYAYGLAEEASKGRLTPEQLQAGTTFLTDLYNGNNPVVKATINTKTKEPYSGSVAVAGTPVYPLEGVEYSDTPLTSKKSVEDMTKRYLSAPNVKAEPRYGWYPFTPESIGLTYDNSNDWRSMTDLKWSDRNRKHEYIPTKDNSAYWKKYFGNDSK